MASMGERRGAYRVLVRNLRERDHLEAPGVKGILILKLTKWGGGGGGHGVDYQFQNSDS
jgi:hypothetical protein